MGEGKARIAVLISGGGTNLQALIDAEKSGILHSGKIVCVISSSPSAYGLTRAENAGIPAFVAEKKALGSQEAFEKAIVSRLTECGAELIVLAGFMSILSADFTARYRDRIINVHPSLIPSFCGKGYYGLKVHEAALARGVKVVGATVHFVDEGTDTGPIILQKAVEVEQGDTPETLQRRVMEQAEWKILPRAIDLIANGRVKVENNLVTIQ